MPSWQTNRDWKLVKQKRDAYRKLLIKKGVIDGSTKMMKLMARKGY